MSLNINELPYGTWSRMTLVGLLLIAGCATDKKQDRVEQAEPDRSVGSTQEAGRSADEPASDAIPKARPAPPRQERARKSPPAQAKKTPPPVQEQAKKSPPPATTGEENKEAREALPTREPQIEHPRTDTADEPKAQQQAKIPGDRVTPLDQSRNTDDVDVTRRIRQKLMTEDLSFSAKNVMVITEPDRVVLKGIVNSPSEAERVKGVAGAMTTKQIEDRLQISGQ